MQSLRPTWELWREWRRLRQSPAHCLHCFSTAVACLPEESADLHHPETGARLHICDTAHLSMARHWVYSIEGLPLEEA
jgi:hypothetical protein